MSYDMTFAQLCQLEPRLRELEMETKAIQVGRDFCANKVWYGSGGLKSRICRLVGNEGGHSKNKTLRSNDSYDVVYQHLWAILPDCKHVGRCAF